ncbi:MAG: ribosome maturation factor RimM, partial [Candidatus Dormibacteraceae bacterium]
MIRIGRVVGVFGIQGALKIELLTDLEGRFAPGAEVYLRQLEHRVEWSRPQGRGRVVKLSGLESRSAAEACRGCYLEAPALPDDRLAPEEWYHDQLLGLRVVTECGFGLGVISDVLELPAN